MTTTTLDLTVYNEVRANVARMKEESATLVFQYDTPKGNKLARSHVATLRGFKGDVERVRKATKAEALEYGRKVDAVARELTAEIEAMIDVHQGPLDLIESREEARKNRHLANVAALTIIPGVELPATSDACRKVLARIKGIIVDDSWQEFKTQGLEAQAASVRQLEAHLTKLLKSGAEAEELARNARSFGPCEAFLRFMFLAQSREEKIRVDAEAKAKREAAEAEARVAREEREKREAEAERATNVKHRAKVLTAVAGALTQFGVPAGEVSVKVAEAIAAGKIRHVTIQF